MQLLIDLLHSGVNVLLHICTLVYPGMLIAIQKIACLSLGRRIFLWQAGWITLCVLKLEAIDFGEPTVREINLSIIGCARIFNYSLVVGEMLIRVASLPDSNLFAMVTL